MHVYRPLLVRQSAEAPNRNWRACCMGHVHGLFTRSWFYRCMDANAGNNHDADLPVAWWTPTPGPRPVPETEVYQPSGAARAGVADSVPYGGSVVFAWIDGQSSRRLHFAGDPLVVLPELEHTDAF